ncbi:hypothetical protein Tco_0937742 [Tanacetum coccineum]|uniref:Uncharacterized protein n=1 Tax=Tanacetum coccineum TaxID=301880 RepID=A0ABQ5DHQ8_9ASTR
MEGRVRASGDYSERSIGVQLIQTFALVGSMMVNASLQRGRCTLCWIQLGTLKQAETNVSDDKSSTYSTCQSNNSEGSIGNSHSAAQLVGYLHQNHKVILKEDVDENCPRQSIDMPIWPILYKQHSTPDLRQIEKIERSQEEEQVFIIWMNLKVLRGQARSSTEEAEALRKEYAQSELRTIVFQQAGAG